MLKVTRLDAEDDVGEARARDYLTKSFDRALLILGDLTSPLIGGVGTAESFRGRGMASTCVSAVVRGLAESGIGECGLFAENSEASLVARYERMGFAARGRFLFFRIPEEIGS